MEPHEFIEGHAQVLEAFGQWPRFHDAEVHRVVLDRTRKSPSGSYYPSVELVIRGWVMTSEVTEGRYFKLEHDSLVHFLFEHVSDVEQQVSRLWSHHHQSSIELLLVRGKVDRGDIDGRSAGSAFGQNRTAHGMGYRNSVTNQADA